jgi:hypothetical protein
MGNQMNSATKPFRICRAQIALAATLTCLAGAALADQTHVSYSLAVGATKAIVLPAANTPIQVSCSQNNQGNVGVGQATINRSSTFDGLVWASFDVATEGQVTVGDSATAGTHIVWCDAYGGIDIEVLSATEIEVKNGSPATASGVVMFVY